MAVVEARTAVAVGAAFTPRVSLAAVTAAAAAPREATAAEGRVMAGGPAPMAGVRTAAATDAGTQAMAEGTATAAVDMAMAAVDMAMAGVMDMAVVMDMAAVGAMGTAWAGAGPVSASALATPTTAPITIRAIMPTPIIPTTQSTMDRRVIMDRLPIPTWALVR